MIIKLLAEGGSMAPGPALSQKIGPIGINIGQVISKVNESTKDFKGLKVPVELDIDVGTKQFEVKVFSPPVSELLKKELGIEKGSKEQRKVYVANASIEQIISVAKQKFPNMLCNNLKTAVKTIIGTCTSLGILIENVLASELGSQIAGGKFHKEIEEGRTETSPEKKAKLEDFFNEVHGKQEELKKAEEEAKEAEVTAKTETTEEKPEEKEETTKAPKK